MTKAILFIFALVSLVYESAVATTAIKDVTSCEDGSMNSLWGLITIKGCNLIVCIFAMLYAIA